MIAVDGEFDLMRKCFAWVIENAYIAAEGNAMVQALHDDGTLEPRQWLQVSSIWYPSHWSDFPRCSVLRLRAILPPCHDLFDFQSKLSLRKAGHTIVWR